MVWDHEQYVDFVKKNALRIGQRGLLLPASRGYNKKFPNIFLTYYSMQDYLDIYSLGPRIGGRLFDSITHDYQYQSHKYQQKLADALDMIAGRGTGQALLQEIAASRRRSLHIMPYLHWKTVGLAGPRNSSPLPIFPGEALANVNMGTLRDTADSYAKGAPVRDPNRWNQPVGDETGTGKGANVVLFYSPEDFDVKDDTDGPGFDPDEVLFHELVHVSRMFRGIQTGLPVHGGGDYGNEEEYLATVIDNLYLSEKDKPLRGVYNLPLRTRHRAITLSKYGFGPCVWVVDPLPKDWAVMKDPDKFFENPDKTSMWPATLIQRFHDAQPDFFRALTQLPDGKPKFNPVKQFDHSLIDI